LVALVATFVTQGLLISPGKVAVPGQEVSRNVNVEGLLDVGGHEVVVAVPTSGADLFRSFWRKLGKAFNGLDIVFLLVGIEGRPSRC
jgi:hypothetical protein